MVHKTLKPDKSNIKRIVPYTRLLTDSFEAFLVFFEEG